jgi:hypothetical protein
MDPYPTPDPTPFFNDVKDVKKIIVFSFFSFLSTPKYIIFSLKLFNKIFVQILFCQALFPSAQDKDPDQDPEPEPDPHL